jgi:SUKH-4 immunity protein
VNSLSEIRREWGDSDFQTADLAQIEPLPLTAADKTLLATIGLPVSPKKALTLNLRFENVFIRHQPRGVRLLKDTDLEKGPLQLSAGSRPHLDSLIVLGTVVDSCKDEKQDLAARAPYEALRRLLGVDGVSGHVWWLYPELHEGQIWCHTINTSFGAYLASLLAYKRFRDGWKDLPAVDSMEYDAQAMQAYDAQAEALYQEFLAKLEAADPAGFKGGFWEEHAWNEHILLHS